MSCTCANHQGHLCILKSKGMTKEIECLINDPKFYCFNCGVEANSEENVCSPVKL